MPRNYALVTTAIWRDDEFTKLSMGAQWLYLLALSQSNLTAVGVVDYTPTRWSNFAEKVTEDDLDGFVAELIARKFVLYDGRTGELLIRTFLKHDRTLENPNMHRSIGIAFRQTLSEALRHQVRESVRDLLPEGVPDPLLQGARNRKQTLHSSSAPSGTPSDRGSGTQSRLPYPYSSSQIPSSSSSKPGENGARAGSDDDDDEEFGEETEGQRRGRIDAAVALLAESDAAAAMRAGSSIRYKPSWLRAARAERFNRNGDELAQLCDVFPDWTAERLAAEIVDTEQSYNTPQPDRVRPECPHCHLQDPGPHICPGLNGQRWEPAS